MLRIGFNFDSAALTPRARCDLDNVAAALNDAQLVGATFTLEGHTDAHGGETCNLQLSAPRTGRDAPGRRGPPGAGSRRAPLRGGRAQSARGSPKSPASRPWQVLLDVAHGRDKLQRGRPDGAAAKA